MSSRLDARVELTTHFAVEEQRARQGQEKGAAREMVDRHDPFGRRDLVMLMISIAILVFAVWWVAP